MSEIFRAAALLRAGGLVAFPTETVYGLGANGKSTFLNVFTGIVGDYHRVAPIETFIASKFEHHPTDLAGAELKPTRHGDVVHTYETDVTLILIGCPPQK